MTSEDEDTLMKLADSTLQGIKMLRSKGVRKRFSRVSKVFEDELEDLNNKYKPSRDGGNSYAEDRAGEDEDEDEDEQKRVGVTAGAVVRNIINPMRQRYSMSPVQLKKKRVES